MASHGCGGDRCCTFCPPRGRRIICSYGRHFGSCTCGDGDLAFLVMGMSDEMSAMMSLSMMALLLLSLSFLVVVIAVILMAVLSIANQMSSVGTFRSLVGTSVSVSTRWS